MAAVTDVATDADADAAAAVDAVVDVAADAVAADAEAAGADAADAEAAGASPGVAAARGAKRFRRFDGVTDANFRAGLISVDPALFCGLFPAEADVNAEHAKTSHGANGNRVVRKLWRTS
ncbi:MAG: hypothetical protein ACLP02_11995 [Rhodomicrobium sp.]